MYKQNSELCLFKLKDFKIVDFDDINSINFFKPDGNYDKQCLFKTLDRMIDE